MPKMAPNRITLDKHGMDELVLSGVDIHIERMDKDCVWMGIYLNPDTHDRICLCFTAKNGAVKINITENDSDVVPQKE